MIQNDQASHVYTIDISDLQAELPLFSACMDNEENIVTLVDPNTLAPPHVPCEDQIVTDPADEALSQATDAGDATEMYNTMELEVDSDLVDAMEEAVQLGSVTPLIKKEIVFSIQHKRLKNGQEELDPKELRKRRAPVPDEVTPEVEERKKRRRDRNKVAAQRCRNRKKERAEQLEEETDELLGQQNKLEEEIDKLKQERSSLLTMLRFHDASQATTCGQKLSQSNDTTQIL